MAVASICHAQNQMSVEDQEAFRQLSQTQGERPLTPDEQIAAAAQLRCECCQTAQMISGAQMHIEHILPRARGGLSEASNLCLACAWCNSYKWAHTQGIDPDTLATCPLFHPRTQRWAEHFRWREDGIMIPGLTAIGRATIAALQMNHALIVTARRYWVEAGWHPPREA